MDFFTELLESFSRKHDRKLRLLEQDEQRVAQAEKAIKSVVAATPPQKGAAVTVGNAKVAHTGTVAGAYNFATYDFKTGKLSPKGKSDFGRVVSAVLGEGDKGEEERKKKKEEAEAALPVITPAIDKALLDIGIDVKADPALAALFRGLYDRALLLAPGAEESGTAGGLASAKRSQALAFVNSIMKDFPIVQAEGDLFRIVAERSSRERTIALAEALNSVGSETFCGRFRRTDNGQIIIDTNYGGKSQGNVFSGGQKDIIDNMLRESNCPEIPTVSIIRDSGGKISSENNTRGTALEKPAELFALARRLRKMQGVEGVERQKVEQMIIEMERDIRSDILSLNRAKETWLDLAENTAIPEESQAEFDYIQSVLQDQGRLIIAMATVARASSDERNPDFVFQAGAVVGGGRKQDSVEMWTDLKAAKAAFKKSTGTVPKLKGVRAEDVYKQFGEEEKFKELLDAGLIEKDTKVYVTEVSYKNLFRAADGTSGGTNLGGGRDSDIDLFMSGRGDSAELFSTFTDAAQMTDDEKLEFDDIHQQQMKIRNQLDSLSNNILTDVDGEEVTVDALSNLVDSVLDNTQTNFTYTEANRSQFRTRLLRFVDDYKNASPDARPNLEKQMKKELLGSMLMSNLRANKDSKAAQFYALALMYKGGGSRNKNTLLQVNNLNTGVSYVSTQNHQFEQIAKSIREGGDGGFNFNVRGKAFSFNKKEDKNASVRLEWNSDDRKWDCFESETMTTKYAQTSRTMFNPEERQDASLVWNALGKLQEALGIIKEKVRVLDTQ
jgi:hypothetical protein